MTLLIIILSIAFLLCLARVVQLKKEYKKIHRFFQLVENSPEGFRIVENGLMTYANHRFCEMTGYTKDELIEKPYELIFSKASLSTVKDNIRLRTQLQSSSYEAELLRKDGAIVPVFVSGQPILDQHGVWVGNCGVFTDITKLKKIEADLRLAEQRLFHSQKLEALGQLSGGIAHDFNNLLAVILGNLEILGQKIESIEGANKYVNRAINGARRASSLTRRLLAFSRRQGLLSKSTDVRGLLFGMMDLLTGSVGESVAITLDLNKDLWFALVDAGQLEAVIINLVVNSRDASSYRITIKCENFATSSDSELVISKALLAGNYLKLSVIDDGQGIEPDLLPKIFEPFFTTKGVGKGSGLGMSIAYGFARESNGYLEVKSDYGKGTTINLYLPKADDAPLAPTIESDFLSIYRGNNERILVVEDEDEVRKLVENMLDFLGYAVTTAHDAESAKKLLRTNSFDLLLVDVVLPDASGSEICTGENYVGGNYSGKIIYMSGYTDLGGITRLSEMDRGDLLNKPFKMLELAQRIKAKIDPTT